jgi:hypothetical protein
MEAEARELVAELKRLRELATARKPFDPDEIVQALGIKLAEVRRSVADAQIEASHRHELSEAKMIERLATLATAGMAPMGFKALRASAARPDLGACCRSCAPGRMRCITPARS